MSPLQTVQHIYAAFGRGDVPTILACLADDVEWEYGTARNAVPWLQPRRGKAEVPGFFDALMGAVEIHHFAPRHFLAEGPLVVDLVDIDFTVRATHRRVEERDGAHVWRFNDAGQVQRFRHCADTWAHAMALRGGAPADRPLNVLGDRIRVLADGSATGGAYEQFALDGDADSGPPPHRHAWDETYCVLEGEVDVLMGDHVERLAAGGYLRVPGGTVHTYRVASAHARMLVTTAGSGAPSQFFAALDREVPPGPPDLPRVLEIAGRFGVEAVM